MGVEEGLPTQLETDQRGHTLIMSQLRVWRRAFQPALETNQKGPTAGSECGGRPSSPLQTSQKRQGHPQVPPVQLR